jgi:tetratricopeptide (TPR) repeat protein
MFSFCLNAVVADVELKHEYILANYYTSLGKYDKAQEWFAKIIADNPPPYVYEGYIEFLYKTKNYALIAALIPKLDALFTDKADIQRMFATSLENIGKQKEAFDRFIAMSKKFSTDQEIIFKTAQIFIVQGNFEKALETIQQYLNAAPRRPNNFIFYFIKGQIHLQLKQIKEAEESIKQSIELYPHFDKSWLLYALIEEQVGNIAHAIDGYTSFLEQSQEAANAQIEQHLLEIVLKQQLTGSGKKQITISGTCFERIKACFSKKKYRKGITQFGSCIQNPTSTDAQKNFCTDNKNNSVDKKTVDEKNLAEVAKQISLGRIVYASRLLQQWMKQDPNNDMPFYLLQLLCHHHVSYKKALRALRRVEKKHPNALLPYVYQADVYLRMNNPTMADLYLHKSLEHTTDPIMQEKIVSQRKLCITANKHTSTNGSSCTIIKKSPLLFERGIKELKKIIIGYR